MWGMTKISHQYPPPGPGPAIGIEGTHCGKGDGRENLIKMRVIARNFR